MTIDEAGRRAREAAELVFGRLAIGVLTMATLAVASWSVKVTIDNQQALAVLNSGLGTLSASVRDETSSHNARIGAIFDAEKQQEAEIAALRQALEDEKAPRP